LESLRVAAVKGADRRRKPNGNGRDCGEPDRLNRVRWEAATAGGCRALHRQADWFVLESWDRIPRETQIENDTPFFLSVIFSIHFILRNR
jgi:hypothetical protein